MQYFPPGREREDWTGIPEYKYPATPTLKSDICRVANGEADELELANTFRSERLSALGNGVVPLTGAVAIQELFRRYLQTRGAI